MKNLIYSILRWRSRIYPVAVIVLLLNFSTTSELKAETWTNYTNANLIRAIAIEGNYVWCGTTGGVVKWNRMDGTYVKYTTADGLTNNYVLAISIDGDGNKWFGTNGGGVSKFDGQTWTTYNTGNSGLAYGDVRALAIDGEGNKWFGTFGGGVSKFDGQTWTTYTTADGLAKNSVNAIAIDRDGNKWFGTNGGGVSKFDGQTWTTYTTDDGLASSYVYSIAIYNGGNKWFGTPFEGVSKFDGQTWTTYTTDDGLVSSTVYSIAIDTEGNKWFGTNGGVSKFDGQTWTNYTTGDGLANGGVRAITIDNDGNKWFGTGDGVSKFDGVNWTTYITGDGLVSNYLSAIAIDNDGNKWFGTGDGVSKFDGQTWTTYTTDNSGLADYRVNAIAIDKEGNKWFGTREGVSKFDGQNWTTYTTTDGLANNYVYAIAIDGNGNKWFGTGVGVSKFDGVNWTTYDTGNSGLANNNVLAIAIDMDGNRWFGTYWGGVSKFDGQTWTTYNTGNSGLVSDAVQAIAIDGDGNKWFGTYNGGVSKFDGQTWTTYNTGNSGLADNRVYTMAIDGDDNKWFGTDGGGVSKFDGQNWTTYTTGNSVLAGNEVYAIAIEAKNDGTKWFGTEYGGVSSLYDGEGYIKYPPDNFMGAVQNPNSIKWTWDEPGRTYGILGYEIKRKEDGGTYQTIADVNALPVGTTYYDDEGLLPNRLYFANISSVYQNRKVPTEDIQRRTLCEVPPAPNVGVGYDGNYYTDIDIVAGNNSSITEYAIFVASGNGTGIGWLDGTGGISGVDNLYKTETGWEDGTSNRHTGLNKGDSYKYAVRAKNYDGIKAPVSTNGLIYCQTITITGPTPPEAKIDGATLQPVYNENKTVTFSSQGIGQIVFYYTYTNDGSSPRDPTNIDNDGTGNLPISANDNEVRTYNIKAIAYDGTGAPSPVAGPWTVMIDKELPANPTTVTESGGALNDTWGTVNDCNFAWSGASDGSGSGVDGYYYYWGTELNGTSTNYTTSAAFNPAAIQEDSGTYYLRIKTKDKAGNESVWTTLYTVKYDGQAPINPTTATESGGAPNDAWGIVNDCNFTWSGASDGAGSGVDGYYYYWGTVSNGTSASYTTSAAFNPAAIQEDLATYYLRVKSKDKVGNESGWTTLYAVKYDGEAPANPTTATESGGAPNDAWGIVNDCDFTWGGASDGSGSGIDGYYYYWGTVSTGTSTNYTTSAGFDPAAIQENLGTYYLRVKTKDKAGNESGWTTLYTVKYDGEAPSNPATVTESGGAPNNTWGTVNDCNFTWSGASDGSGSGVDGYYYYWGTVSNGTSTNYTTSAGFNPVSIQEDSAIYYLRVKTKDKAGNESAWTTLYTVKYDGQGPSFSDYSIIPSSDSISITATAEDTGGSGVSEYYFERKEGGVNSGWIANNFWSDTGLVPNTLYNYTIKCKDLLDNISNELSVFTYTLCEIPGLEITYVTTDSVDMRITGNNSPETDYAIKGFLIVSGFIEKEGYASPVLGRLVLNSDPFWETKENWYKLGSSIDTLTISNLIADGQYEFQVKAKNISGETPFSVAVATTTLALGPPDLEISAVDKSSITIKVSKKGLYAEKFVLAISSISPNGPWAYIQEDYTTGADEYSFLFSGANVKEIVCKDLIGLTAYWFRAKAKDASDNESFLGDWVSATTLSGAPVVKLENYEYGEWTNTLTFSVKSLQGAKNYYYKVDKSSSVQVTTSDPVFSLSTSFIASSEGTWYLNVLGTDGTNPSGRSSYILLVDITAPAANITAEFQNEGLEETQIHSAHEPKFIFPTQENLSGIDGYSYTFSTNANEQPPDPGNVKNTDNNEFTMQFTPANQGGTYYVKVKAKDNAGNWSNVAVFSLKYIPDWTAPKALVNVSGKLERYGESIGVDTDGTINISFDEQIWEGCLKDNTKIIAIRDNEGKSINEETECNIDYDEDKHIAKISPKDGWKKSRKYKLVVKGGIEDKAGNTLGENTESIFTTMLGYKIRNVVMLECDEKTKMILEPNALNEDGYISIDLEPLPLEKTVGAIEATQVNPEAIIEADEKIKNNDDKYSYNLRESMREITGYTGKGDRMVTERFLNSVYVELPYGDGDNDGIVDSTGETPAPVKVITLSIYWLDEEHKLWVRVSGTKVDTEKKVARAKVIGFGVYTIMGGGFYDLSEAYAFPVPYKPNDGNYLTGTPEEGITFTNLTNEAEIEIYTITGELVKRLIHKDGNQEEWNPVENEKGEKVVSGVYVYYVKNARQHKSGKIMIIR